MSPPTRWNWPRQEKKTDFWVFFYFFLRHYRKEEILFTKSVVILLKICWASKQIFFYFLRHLPKTPIGIRPTYNIVRVPLHNLQSNRSTLFMKGKKTRNTKSKGSNYSSKVPYTKWIVHRKKWIFYLFQKQSPIQQWYLLVWQWHSLGCAFASHESSIFFLSMHFWWLILSYFCLPAQSMTNTSCLFITRCKQLLYQQMCYKKKIHISQSTTK